ncbi:MAG: hypothetical protein GY820_27180 [Gammaproteobacteria bacterium]|nr:hypothetical protein [Gammaproteobacteria bacterium]
MELNLSATGLDDQSAPNFDQFINLQVLDLSGNQIVDISVLQSLSRLTLLNLSGNSMIVCADLDYLESILINTEVIRPLSCDTDGDGVTDSVDAFPLDASESVDTDGDGTGNNADPYDYFSDIPYVDVSYTLNYDASSESIPGDGIWSDVTGVSNGSKSFDFTLNAALISDPNTTYAGIMQAYQFDGTNGGKTDSLHSLSSNPSDADASFELWIRPSDLIDDDTVFETGGSKDGMSIVIRDSDSDGLHDDLQFIVKDGNTLVTLNSDLSALLGDVTGEFIQVVGVYDRDYSGTTDRVVIYINGELGDENLSYTSLDANSCYTPGQWMTVIKNAGKICRVFHCSSRF